MYEVIKDEVDPSTVIRLSELDKWTPSRNIIVAEKGDVQDILVCNDGKYHWSSVYCHNVRRTCFYSIKHAITSRLDKGMKVYVLRNRGELRNMLKYNGERQVAE